LIGNGWLRPHATAAVRADWRAAWDVRGRSALRKCMFLPIPEGMRPIPPQVSPAALPPRAPAPARSRARDVQLLPALSRADDASARALYAKEQAKLLGDAPRTSAWYEDPIALGSLLLLCPPVGLAALWSSKRYSNDARWALTLMTALMLCLGVGLGVALTIARL
jgi:hypothetical protein